MEIKTITESQKNKILNIDESHFFDVKAIEIKPAKLTQTLIAFANADGGELFIGIDEKDDKSHKWRGFPNPEAANGHLQCFEEVFPLGQDIEYTFLECEKSNGLVLKVDVAKSSNVRLATNGKAYIRKGAQKLPVDTDEKMHQLRLLKGIDSFESETVNVEVEIISNTVPIIGFLVEVIPSPPEPEDWLRKNNLIRRGNPSVAGVLLFAEIPQAFLPKRCGIKIYRYKTRETASRETLDFDPITIEGHLYQQIYDAVDKTKEIINTIPVMGEKGFEKIHYPEETLHEILTNAVLHRDYNITDDIHVRIFDNRVEIESPGKLPGHVTVKNILSERFSRNPSIVRLINKFPNPPNKDVGEGLHTAFNAMRNLKLRDPIINELENAVLVAIRHEPLASPEEAILEYLQKNEEIRNSIARDITYIRSENSMKRVLQRMVEHGLIEPTGKQGNAYSYRLKDE